MAVNRSSPEGHPLVRPFQAFFRMEAAGGILLLICAVVALVWANSRWSDAYFGVWSTVVTVGFGEFEISKELLLWVNDGLMAIFFFVVGLEIKREVLMGELGSPRKAALALVAALGGMVIPAVLYAVVNRDGPGAAGWGIPMATDIAFALGVLALLGRRAPLALKIFLTALAIVDDLGAVMVIAVFYTAQLKTGYLLLGAAVLGVLVLVNRAGVRRSAPYVVLGLVLWLAFLKSGVHATIAGVLLAMTIPARRMLDGPAFLARGRSLMERFARDVREGEAHPTADQVDVLHALEDTAAGLDTPLHRMEHALHGWVAFGIMPVFALANAGVSLGGGVGLGSSVTIGVILGLFVGKQLGVAGFSWLAVRLGWAELPAGVSWRQLYGVSLLTGIGFTMSLFIANLAFDGAALLDGAKVGILLASLLSGVAGWLVLARAERPEQAT